MTGTGEDSELAYEEGGRGRPVVFLHADGMTRAMWEEQFTRFAHSHRVIRYDARGSGGSPKPSGAFSHHEDLKHLLDTLEVDRPVLVGCSFGSRVFLDFAPAYPDRVGGLVLSSPGISGMEFRDPSSGVCWPRRPPRPGWATAPRWWSASSGCGSTARVAHPRTSIRPCARCAGTCWRAPSPRATASPTS
ncbi:alpha/beta fold hydrolase, partial [Amycolatopsis sp. NPDC049252]|uniref:alpha/beta fold hydrolase n=1 Tax=Amycolatopsis sp. NPDC049252 TaxID=3363933 RepID=UPI00371A7798